MSNPYASWLARVLPMVNYSSGVFWYHIRPTSFHFLTIFFIGSAGKVVDSLQSKSPAQFAWNLGLVNSLLYMVVCERMGRYTKISWALQKRLNDYCGLTTLKLKTVPEVHRRGIPIARSLRNVEYAIYSTGESKQLILRYNEIGWETYLDVYSNSKKSMIGVIQYLL